MFKSLRSDFQAIKERDPAARWWLDRVLCYQGFHALVLYRFSHWLYNSLKLKLLARVLSLYARIMTGIEIHPGAKIGRGVFIDHGMGVIIGETTIIGDSCTIYQGVTLGGTGKTSGKRHPTLEEGVVVGANACVLGNITIGRFSRIGAGSVAVRDVPAESTVVGVPGRIINHQGTRVNGAVLDHGNLPDPIRNALQELHEEIKEAEGEIHSNARRLEEQEIHERKHCELCDRDCECNPASSKGKPLGD
jgi:serine O-acetyltransferase